MSWRAIALVCLALVGEACECGHEPSAAPASAITLVAEPIALGYEARTTDGDVALTNLGAQIDSLEQSTNGPEGPMQAPALASRLLLRSPLRGDIADVDRALTVADTTRDTTVRAQLRASVFSALHEWDRALAELPDEPASDRVRDSIALARGRDVDAIVQRRQARVDAGTSFQAESDLAIALSEAGRFDDADAAYLRALASYRDISPFPVAVLQFQRGVMWAERAGRPGRAVTLYREAVARLPSYTVANVHLAELEVRMGQRDEAIARLRRVSQSSPDPEAAGILAELLATSAPDEARLDLDLARTGYERLLAAHPAAYADHGAEFFMGAGGDPARARDLAMTNLASRPTERAFQLAIRAALAADDHTLACSLIDRVSRPIRSVPLTQAVESVGDCP